MDLFGIIAGTWFVLNVGGLAAWIVLAAPDPYSDEQDDNSVAWQLAKHNKHSKHID